MGIEEVAEIIRKIADGFEEACMRCLDANSDVVVASVHEQLWSGLNGKDEHLSPTYDNDPYFDEDDKNPWYGCSQEYKDWKMRITPPSSRPMLGLPPRPTEVPNLCIDGTFYSEITASRQGDELLLDPGQGNGLDIVDKYGDVILDMGSTAVEYFNANFMLPAIEDFFKDCGYR